MISRERVIRTIGFKNPDQIPIMHSFLPGAFMHLGDSLDQVFSKFPSDFAGQNPPYCRKALQHPRCRKSKEEDRWGCIWQRPGTGIEGQVIKHPLNDWSKMRNYHFPNLTPNKKDIENIKKFIKKEKKKDNPRFILVGFGDGRTWERYHFLRGFTNALIDIAEDNPNMYELLNKIAEMNLKALLPILELEIDGVSTMDDWGTQSSLMVNPILWRKIFKPIYKKYINLTHEAGKYFFLHSDGNTLQIIDDLIEINLDVYNPQFSCMNLGKLANKVRGKMCISSDIDRQYILPKGRPNEVKEYVEKVIEMFWQEGGLIDHIEIGPDVPLKNATSAFSAFKKYGNY